MKNFMKFLLMLVLHSSAVYADSQPDASDSGSDKKPEPKKQKQINSTDMDLNLRVELKGFPLTESFANKTLKFEQACEVFTHYLINNGGLWGTGPFQSSDCKSAPGDGWTWKLRISGNSDEKIFEILYKDQAGKETIESRFTLKTEIGPILLISKSKTRSLIAGHLAISLPFRSIVASKVIKDKAAISFKGYSIKGFSAPDDALQIFTLYRADGLWQPKVIAAADYESTKAGRDKWRVSEVDSEALAASQNTSADAYYFMQQSSGRDEALAKIELAISNDLTTFIGKFINVARSAYVGVRYGIPFGAGSGVLAKAPLIGLFGEFRGGPLNGLKLSYDVIPSQKVTSNTSTDEFSWSRIQMGYSFGRKLKNRVFNWVDITPKLGVTNLVLNSTAAADSEAGSYSFKLHRSPTLGAELGLENRGSWFLSRVWGYGSYSLGVVDIDRANKNSSLRLGLDIYREVAHFRTIKVALLGFSAIAQESFTKILTASELAANPDQTKAIKYSTFYAGGGVTLTW